MKRFSILQRVRNKIKADKSTKFYIAKSAKIVACRIEVRGKNNIVKIAEGVKLRDVHLEIIGEDCCICIDRNSTIGHQSYLSAKGQKIKLQIGEDCMLSRNVKVMTSDGHPLFVDEKVINEAQSIKISNRVWLADNVTLLKGVSVGEDAVVGINATLTHTIEAGAVAVGNPAKVVKTGVRWQK